MRLVHIYASKLLDGAVPVIISMKALAVAWCRVARTNLAMRSTEQLLSITDILLTVSAKGITNLAA